MRERKKEIRLSTLEVERLGFMLVFPQYRDKKAEENSRIAVAALTSAATQDHVADVGSTIEPFGYFKADPLGWTDCEIADAGAVALYDKSAIDALISQRDALLTALRGFVEHGTCFDDNDFDRALAAIAMVEGGEVSKAFSAPPVL